MRLAHKPCTAALMAACLSLSALPWTPSVQAEDQLPRTAAVPGQKTARSPYASRKPDRKSSFEDELLPQSDAQVEPAPREDSKHEVQPRELRPQPPAERQEQPFPRVDPTQPDDELPPLLRPLRELETRIKIVPGKYLPPDPAAEFFAQSGESVHQPGTQRDWPMADFYWLASGLCHYPLYFQDVNLERYGYSCGKAQPIVSAAHFFGRLPALPYLMAIDPPHRCKYALGYYRPGSCAPMRTHLPPWDPYAAVVQGGAVTGLVFLIP